jgi:hypothetical protein
VYRVEMRARQQARPWRRVRERWRRANGDARSSPSAALDERPRTSRSGPSSWAFAVWDRSNDHCTTARRLHSRPRRTIGRGAARRKNSVARLAGSFNGQFRSSLCITLMTYMSYVTLGMMLTSRNMAPAQVRGRQPLVREGVLREPLGERDVRLLGDRDADGTIEPFESPSRVEHQRRAAKI